MNDDEIKEHRILSFVIVQAHLRQKEMLMPRGLREDLQAGWAIKVRNMIEELTNPSNYGKTSTQTPQESTNFKANLQDWQDPQPVAASPGKLPKGKKRPSRDVSVRPVPKLDGKS